MCSNVVHVINACWVELSSCRVNIVQGEGGYVCGWAWFGRNIMVVIRVRHNLSSRQKNSIDIAKKQKAGQPVQRHISNKSIIIADC